MQPHQQHLCAGKKQAHSAPWTAATHTLCCHAGDAWFFDLTHGSWRILQPTNEPPPGRRFYSLGHGLLPDASRGAQVLVGVVVAGSTSSATCSGAQTAGNWWSWIDLMDLASLPSLWHHACLSFWRGLSWQPSFPPWSFPLRAFWLVAFLIRILSTPNFLQFSKLLQSRSWFLLQLAVCAAVRRKVL